MMAKGSMRHSAGDGKKIDAFPYEVVQVEGCEPIRVLVEVFMRKDFEADGAPPKPVTGAKFILACGDDRIEGSDIDACISAMRSKLDKRYAIKWEPWLKVGVQKERVYMATGTGLSLRWEEVERGRAFDGSDLMRVYSRREGKTWEVSPWPKYFKDRNGNTLACIPRTDENEEALRVFAEKIDEMRKALAEFVSPDAIETTLGLIASGGLNLLPSHADG